MLQSLPALDRRAFLAGGAALGLGIGALTAGAARAQAPGPSLQQTMREVGAILNEDRIPGLICGFRMPDGTEHFLSGGRTDFDPDASDMARRTLFRIYSMTKPITGAAAAMAMEDGRLTLDKPVADFVPEFAAVRVAVDPDKSLESCPAKTVMTVRHLLTHTAGLSYHIAGDGPVQRAYREAGLFPVKGNLNGRPTDAPQVRDLEEFAVRLARIPLMFDPGTAWHYSASLDLLGLVIQRAVGLPFPEYLQRRLFDPAGMTDTGWSVAKADLGRFAALYDYAEDGTRKSVPEASAEVYATPTTLFSGGAGLVSSARDYLRFLSVMLDDGRSGGVRIMKPETARLIRTDVLPAGVKLDDGARYGFGGYVTPPGKPDSGRFGWSGAASTEAWVDPATRTAATILQQVFPYARFSHVDRLRKAFEADVAALG